MMLYIFENNNELHYIDTNNDIFDYSYKFITTLNILLCENTINNNLCEKYNCEYNIFMKHDKYLIINKKYIVYNTGFASRLSLYYNTHRNYILILIFGLLYVLYNLNKIF